MSENKLKTKNAKRLPSYIQFSVILSYFITSMVGTSVAYVISQMNINNTESLFLFITMFCVPIIGFIFGWWMKFNYVGKQDDDAQKIKVKAQFWGTMAFVVAFIASLLLILILLIMVENNSAMPNNVASPIIAILSFLIIAFSALIAYNTKKRVYRNFGL